MWYPEYIKEMKDRAEKSKSLGLFNSIPISIFITYWEEQYKAKVPDFIKKDIEKHYFMRPGFIAVIDAIAYWNDLEDRYKNGGITL